VRKFLGYLFLEGFFPALIKVFDFFLGRSYTFFYSYSWFFRGCNLGRSPRVYGVRCITLGEKFHAKKNLWLDAVQQFNGQLFSPTIIIGKNVNCSVGVHIAVTNSLFIGDCTLIGSNVLIVDHSHGCYHLEQSNDFLALPPIDRELYSSGSVRIGRNCWIGDGVVILPGSDIGDGVVVAANSVINGVVPSYCLCAGAPALIKKRFAS